MKVIVIMERIGRVVWGWLKLLTNIFLFYTVIYFLSWIPDSDQYLIKIFHHRSIVTHSILLPLLLLLITRGSLRWFSALLFSAFGIHLSADLLSSSIGYGAIWLPYPLKLSLGEFSKLWILVNAIAAFYLSYRSLSEMMQFSVFWSTSLAGISYGLQNEESIFSAIVILFFSVSVGIWQHRRLQFLFIPSYDLKIFHAHQNQIDNKERKYFSHRRMGGFRQRSKSILEKMVHLIIFLIKVVLTYPKISIIVAIIVAFLMVISLLTGSNFADDTIKAGEWVLHSSGGWILKEGGRYVGGTLTSIKP